MGLYGQYWALVKKPLIFALVAIFFAGSAPGAQAACRQALSLGLDVSGSVDRVEYAQQINGVAAALADPEVQKAFLSMPDARVRLHIYEWAGSASKRVLLPWQEIERAEDLLFAAEQLLQTDQLHPREPGTALGEAMLYGAAALAKHPDCWKRTLDISSDGPSNTGPRPRDVMGDSNLRDVTVNALVIGSADAWMNKNTKATINGLRAYFKAEVIQGPYAFVQTAVNYADYADAIAAKLLRELETLAIGNAGSVTDDPNAG